MVRARPHCERECVVRGEVPEGARGCAWDGDSGVARKSSHRS